MKWFRFYTEALDDPKVQRLTPTLFKTWVNLLCIAGQNNGKLPSLDDLAFRLRLSAHETEQQVSDLILAGLIDIQTDKTRTPHNWHERQYASDTSSERVRRHRLKKHEETAQNACNVSCNGSVTPQNRTDSDTETDTDNTPLPPKGAEPVSIPKFGKLEALEAFTAYNAVAQRCGLPQAAKLTPDRQRRIVARLKDYGLEGWHRALANIEKSSFLTAGTDRGFRADLDFVCQAKSFSKLHDGGYGNGRHVVSAPSANGGIRLSPAQLEAKREREMQEWAEQEFAAQEAFKAAREAQRGTMQ